VRPKGYQSSTRILIVFLTISSLSVQNSFVSRVSASSQCTNPPTNAPSHAWPGGQSTPYSIPYYIDPSFSSPAQNAIIAAFNSWSGTNGVSFVQVNSSAGASYQVNSGALGSTLRGTTGGTAGSSARATATTTLNTAITNMMALQEVMVHEIGHSFGLADCPSCAPGTSAMVNPAPSMNDTTYDVTAPTSCDQSTAIALQPPTPPPPPTQACTPSLGSCAPDTCVAPSCGPLDYFNYDTCKCVYTQSNPSPIVIDTDGTGFHLTSATYGVLFDFFGNGKPIQIAWTAEGSTNGWLALDRNGNGTIDSAEELFGNITAQPPSSDPNGFLALAVFDLPENGGNGDGVIDSRDAIWPKLLVWIDANHDGISQADELHNLDDLGIQSIALDYVRTPFKDEFGNKFRYKGRLNPDRGDKVNRIIYDVFLSYVHPQTAQRNSTENLKPRSHSFASLLANSAAH